MSSWLPALVFGVFLGIALRIWYRSWRKRRIAARRAVVLRGSYDDRFMLAYLVLKRGDVSESVPILEALNIVRGAIDNVVVQSAIDKVRDSIREGEGIAAPRGASGVFDDIVVNMVDVGEETGELDKMLIKVADNYDEEVDNAVNGLVSILQPLLIVCLGGAVFVIVLSVFLPMLQLVNTLGGGG